MYVTRPLSLYRNSPSSLSSPPPEGPNSGILVFEDEEDHGAESRGFFGLFKKKESVKVPPLPQNRILRLTHAADAGEFEYSDSLYAVLVPVLNQPLSSNRYYVIDSHGSAKGLVCTSSKEDDTSRSSRFCYSIPDAPSQLLDPKNTYQQFQISNYVFWGKPNGFLSKSMAPDGVPPELLRRKGWRAYPKPLNNNNLAPTEALGLDAALRARLPDLTFPPKPVVVGKWYCPFIFVRDGEVGSQMSSSPYYEMTLEQNWEEIFGCGNFGGGGRMVDFDVSVEREVVSVAGRATDGRDAGDGVMWFGSSGVGLSLAIVERVKWEEEKVGFEFGKEKEKRGVKVKRREEFKERGDWRRFGCYVLVERFVLKRMDGSLVLTWEFRHTHQIKTKWE